MTVPLKVLEKLAREGKTMMLVTHEMGFARSVASRVLFMHAGRIWEHGAPGDVLDHPRTPELRTFLAAVLQS